MDPICEEKYNFLQKYVPFLANIIELLANDNEKQDKLAQMQLLYNLLNKPDNSVKIETLQKCEEVLCRVFGNSDEPIGQDEWIMPSPLIKAEVVEETDEALEQIQEENSENLNGSLENSSDILVKTIKDTLLPTDILREEDQAKINTEKPNEKFDNEQTDCFEPKPSKQQNIQKNCIPEENSKPHETNIAEEEQSTNYAEVKSNNLESEKEPVLENETNVNIEIEGGQASYIIKQDETKNGVNLSAEIEAADIIVKIEKAGQASCIKKQNEIKNGVNLSTEIEAADLIVKIDKDITKQTLSETCDSPKIKYDLSNDHTKENYLSEVADKEEPESPEKEEPYFKKQNEEKNKDKLDIRVEAVKIIGAIKQTHSENEPRKDSEHENDSSEALVQEIEPEKQTTEGSLGFDINEISDSLETKKFDHNEKKQVSKNQKDPTSMSNMCESNDELFPQTNSEKNTEKKEIPSLDVELILRKDLTKSNISSPEISLAAEIPPTCEESSKNEKEKNVNICNVEEGVEINPNTNNAAVSEIDKTYNPDVIEKISKNSHELIQDQNESGDVIRQSESEMLTFKIVSAESLALTKITNTDVKDDENLKSPSSINKETATEAHNDLVDPLEPLIQTSSISLKTKKLEENGSTSQKEAKKDEDDDDVLLVETRSSPICIDSDPEDEDHTKGNRFLPLFQTKLPLIKPKLLIQKPKVRKATSAVMETIRQIINKNQNIAANKKVSIKKKQNLFRDSAFVKKDPKALMETIDLLDSDSDEERSKNNCKNTVAKGKTDDDVIIVSSSQPQRRLLTKKSFRTVPSPKQITRITPKLVNKSSPPKPATAQSNFLNAVNLQPAAKAKSSSNPATFSAQLSNKKVIIPNAFYGNPSYNRKSSSLSSSTAPSRASTVHNEDVLSNNSTPAPPPRTVGVYSGVSIRHVQDKVLKEWLEGFLTNFASPLQIASHACFVLLQRVLKYRFFQRLKETRIFLNTMAKNCSSESVDVQMLLDLRNVFLENDYLTEAGRRFCRFATNDAFGKPVALTTDSKTGRVTCRTRVATKGDLPTDIAHAPNNVFIKNPPIAVEKPATSSAVQSPALSSATIASTSKPINSSTKSALSPLSNVSTPSSVPKRRGKFRKLSDGLVVAENDEDDNDYTPAINEIEPEAEIITERKRSLRTNRTKRKEAGFTYSEDHDDEEFEALARKIENKKREELRLAEEREEMERELLEQQSKANKKTVAKKTTAKRQVGQVDNTRGPTRKKLRLANISIVGAEDNDLLTPTWIEADGDEVDSLLDFADEPQSPEMENSVFENDNSHENICKENATIDETSQESSESFDIHTNKLLKNIDRKLHLHCKTHDFCVHCQRRVPRIVHHYVNEHRSSEVFPSRLRNRDIRRLLTTSNVGFVHLYKGNQIQYAAHCIFCDKEAKFLLPYWFEHFTMHTGEYSFKCNGCNVLKPTRSLLTNHLTSNSGCPKKGKTAVRLVNFDTKVHQIEAHICSICNYTQLHRNNLLRHLKTQHGIDTISQNQIIKVVLLQISAPYGDQDADTNEESQLSLLQPSDDEDTGGNETTLDENSLMIQNDFTDNDDLSFMICGMLDVQTNLSQTGGEYSGNIETTNTVDNK